tara:strand:- start:4828 stop:5094 length:267 start_codon:yes stop_codon:yes gene_type:complete
MMLRFYNGAFRDEDLDNMSIDLFNQYWSAINVIESKEMLSDFTVADFPHLKSGKRKEIYNKVQSCLRQEKNVATSTREIARMLGAING